MWEGRDDFLMGNGGGVWGKGWCVDGLRWTPGGWEDWPRTESVEGRVCGI